MHLSFALFVLSERLSNRHCFDLTDLINVNSIAVKQLSDTTKLALHNQTLLITEVLWGILDISHHLVSMIR